MNTHGSAVFLLGAALFSAACSGTYQVGSDPGTAGTASSSGAGSTGSESSSNGAAPSAGGSVSSTAQGGSNGTGIIDPAAESRCGFMPEAEPSANATFGSTADVLARLQMFLEDASTAPPVGLPPKPTADFIAAQAMAMLDAHLAAKTEAPGLVRFLATWLALPKTVTDPKSPHSWSLQLLDPRATLSSLLADPTGKPHRFGVLTDPEVLAARSHTVARGYWMMSQLFCTPVPPPPPGVPPLDPTMLKGTTNREKLEEAVAAPTCQSCHQLMNPAGESLENYDAMGNYREVDNGAPVDASGSIPAEALTFTSFEDLAPQLATSCDVAQCFSSFLMKDALAAPAGTTPFTNEELNHVANAFANSGFSIRELVKAVVTSPSFMR
jgi:hypothetical protein